MIDCVFFFCCLYDLKMKGKGICEREVALKKVACSIYFKPKNIKNDIPGRSNNIADALSRVSSIMLSSVFFSRLFVFSI